jgi:hypothetical protein
LFFGEVRVNIDLSNWKLTLPVGGKGKPTEIKQPALATYTGPHFLRIGNTLMFIAPTDGVTTKNSKNPRCELRQMSGDKLAAWSSTVGRNTMTVELSVDVLPIGPKPHVVVAQIHDGGDDVTVFRVEGSTTDRGRASIWITDGDSTRGFMLTDNYRLGERIQVGFDIADGVIRYTFNGATVDYWQAKKVTGCYFKTGCYNQSGGIVTRLPDGRPDYAQVTIYACTVTGEAATGPVVVPGTPDDTAKQIAELQRQLAEFQRQWAVNEQRWAALRKAVTQ